MRFEKEIELEKKFVELFQYKNKKAKVERQFEINSGIVDIKSQKGNQISLFECKLSDVKSGIKQLLKYQNYQKNVSLVVPQNKEKVVKKYQKLLSTLKIKVYLVSQNNYKIIKY